MDKSEIVHFNGGTAFIGPDAVNLVRAAHCATALRMYARTKMLMTRMATPTVLLQIAKEYTGKDYKGADKYLHAADDLRVWIETMKSALPITDERTQP
jgi:hypothetical protein